MSADDLTPAEVFVLLTLMAEARPVTNTELKALGPELRPESRRKLNRLQLVETDTTTRPFTHELADKGWARCHEVLGSQVPPRIAPAGRALFTVLAGLGRYLTRNDLRLADVFAPAEDDSTSGDVPAASEPAPAVTLEERVRSSYARRAAKPGGWVNLGAVRADLADVARDVLDREFIRMYRLPDVTLVPIENQKTLTEQDRLDAVVIGNQPKHVIAIEA